MAGTRLSRVESESEIFPGTKAADRHGLPIAKFEVLDGTAGMLPGRASGVSALLSSGSAGPRRIKSHIDSVPLPVLPM